MTFADRVREIVRRIPKGKSMTYKEVAARAGNAKAARAVGAIMRTNYDE
ncbi:MAG TPA: MGMT family protein, partial [Candidatus Paceibacterota bacterium]